MEFGFPIRPNMPVLYRETPDAAPVQIKAELNDGGVCVVAAGFQPAETGVISCGSREFRIVSVSPSSRHGFMTLDLRERTE